MVLREDLKTRINQIKAEMKEDLKRIRAEMREDSKAMETRMDIMFGISTAIAAYSAYNGKKKEILNRLFKDN